MQLPHQTAKVSSIDIGRYLARLDIAGPVAPNIAGLRRLHRAHLEHVPFENFDVHMRRTIHLNPTSLFEKVVLRRRGGICYELNGLFAALLEGLGFRVRLLSARVIEPDRIGPEFDHLVLLVEIEQAYIADVGFGDAFLEPLSLLPGLEQTDGRKIFVPTRAGDQWELAEQGDDGNWIPQYRFGLTPRRLGDFDDMCVHHQNSSASKFTRESICTRATPSGRLTVKGNHLIEIKGGQRIETSIESKEQMKDLLGTRFGLTDIDFDVLPTHSVRALG